MGTGAFWLSRQERVEVEELVHADPHERYKLPKFQVKRYDGSRTTVDRRDIILEDEQQLIDELAAILYGGRKEAHHERYAFIMRQFLVNGVPYVSRLMTRKPKSNHQQSFDLFDVS